MAVTTYAASGQLALSAFRTTVVDDDASVSMSKLVNRVASSSTTTTDIQFFGTNTPWNEDGSAVGTNNSIPIRTSSAPTPAIAISDFHGAYPWFWTLRANTFKYEKYVVSSSTTYDPGSKSYNTVTVYGTKLTWDNVLVHTLTTSYPASITTGGYTYYKGQSAVSNVARIGRD